MPNRVLRDWTDSYAVNGLSSDGEKFFTRLIMKVDDFGRFSADPSLLRPTLFPLQLDFYNEEKIAALLSECVMFNLVVVYTADDRDYLCINNFNQRFRAKKSRYPKPPSPSCDGHVTDMCPTSAPEDEDEDVDVDVDEEEKSTQPITSIRAEKEKSSDFSDSDSADSLSRVRATTEFRLALAPFMGRDNGKRHPKGSPQYEADLTCATHWVEDLYPDEQVPVARHQELMKLVKRANRAKKPMAYLTHHIQTILA